MSLWVLPTVGEHPKMLAESLCSEMSLRVHHQCVLPMGTVDGASPLQQSLVEATQIAVPGPQVLNHLIHLSAYPITDQLVFPGGPHGP